jgi:hypothetical protein
VVEGDSGYQIQLSELKKKIVYKPKIGKVLNEMKCKINLFWILSNITPNIINSITSHLIKTFNSISDMFIGFKYGFKNWTGLAGSTGSIVDRCSSGSVL